MRKHPRLVLLLIALLAMWSFWINLPTATAWNFNVLGKNIKIPLNRDIKIPFANKSLTHNYDIKTGLDIQGGSHLIFEADMNGIKDSDRLTALEAAKTNILGRVDSLGVGEPVVQTSQSGQTYRILVELPGVKNTQEAINLIGQTAQLDFRVPNPATESGELFLETGLTGKNLSSATPSIDPNSGANTVQIVFDDEGRDLFGKLTTEYVGRQIYIFLDDKPLSAPVVNQPITGGNAIITGGNPGFTAEETKQLSIALNAGALPVPVKLVQQQTVGATLGSESINASIKAGLIGLFTVAVFMLVYYGRLGIVALLGLVIYALLSFTVYKLLGITLSLPGITGFLLSVGMAVDANILIFERYKEEIRLKRSPQLAMEQAFGRAWDSIRDANVCTLATSFILYSTTNSVVRGFAVTLSLGIFISLFTGIVVSRTLLRSVMPRPRRIKIK